MRKGATISKNGIYRYLLWRIWDESKPRILFIGLNPSTADAAIDDPTVRRLILFTKKWNYGGFYLANLFAYRSADPAGIYSAKDPLGPKNWEKICQVKHLCEKVVFMWGVRGSYLYQDAFYKKAFPNAYCFKKSIKGFPHHPLYLLSNTELIKF